MQREISFLDRDGERARGRGREGEDTRSVSTKIHDESRKLKAEGTKPDGRYLSLETGRVWL